MQLQQVVPIPSMLYRDFIYDCLAPLEPRLMVDVGAADGEVSRRLADIGGSGSEVIAFEPFEPNVVRFRRNTAGLPSVELRERAVSSALGTTTFFVGSSVGSGDSHDDRAGFSAVGQISRSRTDWLKQGLKVISAPLRGKHGAGIVRVPTTTLDTEFDSQQIDFLKVDVQGAEALVLTGARRLIEDGRIKMMYLEWFGDEAVLAELRNRDVVVYDTTYFGGDRTNRPDEFERLQFEVREQRILSTGDVAFEMIYHGDDDRGELLRRLNVTGRRWVQTDLLVVHDSVNDRMLDSIRSQLGFENCDG